MAEADEQARGNRSVEQRVEDISVRLAKVETYFKVAFGIGAIFGAVGVWGFQMISSVSSRISGLDTELTKVGDKLTSVDSRANELKKTYEGLRDEVIPSLQSLFTQLKVDTVSANKEAQIALARIDGQTSKSVSLLDGSARDAGDRVGEKSRAAVDDLNTGRTEALTLVRGETDHALTRVQEQKDSALGELRQEIDRRLDEATRSVTWSGCTWHEIGVDKSHYPDRGEWCPGGKFLTQLDLTVKRGIEVYVQRVRCCAPAYGR